MRPTVDMEQSARVHRLAVVARGCRGDVTSAEEITAAVRTAAMASGLTVVAEATYAYVPHGLSVALLLAQSHLVVSTWPEHQVVTADLAVCGLKDRAWLVWRELNSYFRPTHVELQEQRIELATQESPSPGSDVAQVTW